MDKWADAAGAHIVINHVAQMVLEPNPEGRTEGLSWILRNSSSVADADMSSMVSPMLKCLTDRSKDIRTKAEEVIGLLMVKIGASPFMTGIKSENQATQQTLRPILDKIKANTGGDMGGDEEEPAPAKGATGKKTSAKAPAKKEKEEEKAPAAPPGGSFAKKGLEKKKAEAARPSTKPVPQEDELQITPGNKAKREQQDSRTKYAINEVKGDHIERLQTYCTDVFGQKFSD